MSTAIDHPHDTLRPLTRRSIPLLFCAALLLGGCAGPTATSPPEPPKPGRHFASVAELIASQLTYPAGASLNKARCDVSVRYLRDGKIVETKLEKSTGDAVLDQECLDVFRRIDHFPPLPANVPPDLDSFSITVPLNFEAP